MQKTDRKRALHLLKLGNSKADVGRILGVTRQTVHQIIREQKAMKITEIVYFDTFVSAIDAVLAQSGLLQKWEEWEISVARGELLKAYRSTEELVRSKDALGRLLILVHRELVDRGLLEPEVFQEMRSTYQHNLKENEND